MSKSITISLVLILSQRMLYTAITNPIFSCTDSDILPSQLKRLICQVSASLNMIHVMQCIKPVRRWRRITATPSVTQCNAIRCNEHQAVLPIFLIGICWCHFCSLLCTHPFSLSAHKVLKPALLLIPLILIFWYITPPVPTYSPSTASPSRSSLCSHPPPPSRPNTPPTLPPHNSHNQNQSD